MQIIKYCMLFFIFTSSVLIGRYISKQYSYRLKELEEIKNALNIFKTKIKFTYNPIPEIFNEISKTANTNISKLFREAKEKMKNGTASIAWEEAVEEIESNLKKEDKQAIKTLSKLLRNNRYRRANKPNRINRKLFGKANNTSIRRKEQKWKIISKVRNSNRYGYSNNINIMSI